MEERRKAKRSELTSHLLIKRLDSNEMEEVKIHVENVSKSGIGFNCTEPLTIGGVYEGYIMIWTKELIHAFIEIVRIEKKEDTFQYGGFFVGMPEMEAFRIEVYQTVEELGK